MRDLGFMNYADPVLKAILGNIDTVHAVSYTHLTLPTNSRV